MSKTKAEVAAEEERRATAIRELRELFDRQGTRVVYTTLEHVSASGMMRRIKVLVAVDNHLELLHTYGGCQGNYLAGKPKVAVRDISWSVAQILGLNQDKHRGGVKVGGGGMDMGFSLVYGLGSALYPDGFKCLGEGCRANDHFNGDRDYGDPEKVHRDGGYRFEHQWL